MTVERGGQPIRCDDSGSSLVDFLVGLAMVLTIALAVSQIAIAVFVGNVATAAAHEGARTGAAYGSSPDEARARAIDALRGGIGGYADSLRVSAFRSGASIVVEIDGLIPSTMPAIPRIPVRVRAEAFDEAGVFK